MVVFHVIGLAFLVGYHREFLREFRMIIANPILITEVPLKIMNCMKCSSFWFALLLTNWDAPLSGFISLIGFLIDKYLLSTDIEL
tara:strand:+ start:884 stop:1138 length:255 start_codon:yes stop_codon:yes gene_type:complete